MAKFKLVAGRHVANGRTYLPGEIINSHSNLAKIFPGNFKPVADDTPEKAEKQPVAAGPVETPVGQPVPSPKPTEPVSQPEKPATKAAKAEKAKDWGLNVTKSFPLAVDEDFRVFKKDWLYFVFDADNMDKPMNDVGVAKTGVDKVIHEALRK